MLSSARANQRDFGGKMCMMAIVILLRVFSQNVEVTETSHQMLEV